MGTDMRHSLASTVEGARVHAGVSATRLAELSGVEPDALVDLLEAREDFTIVDLARIAAALGVPITTLLPGSVPED